MEFKNTTVSEADLAALLQATQSAGYKISVDSPETMPEVKGLTHNHIIEIAPNVFMKFKHSYVVVEAREQVLRISDPHGKVEGSEKDFYNENVANSINQLHNQFDLLMEELKDSGYSTFTTKTKIGLNQAFKHLEDYSDIIAIANLESKWTRLLNRKELKEEENTLSGLKPKAGESFLEQVKKLREALREDDIGKGFLRGKEQIINGKQDIKYTTIKNNFESIRINKIT